jgi:hypothetical protein
MSGQGDISCSRLRHKLPLRSQEKEAIRGVRLADSSKRYTAEGIARPRILARPIREVARAHRPRDFARVPALYS